MPRHRWTARIALLLSVVAAMATAVAVAGPAQAVVPTGPTTDRIAGTDRYDTSVQIAKAGYPTTASIVFLATGTNYPDALAAGPTAAKKHGPLLLTDPASLPAKVSTELGSLHPDKVVIVGGTSAVSDAVKNQVHTLLPSATITRLAGTDRYDTARQVVRYGFTSVSDVYVATGANYPDALSAAADGGANGSPVVLVNGAAGSLDAATRKLFTDLGVHTAGIVGGTAAVSTGIASSLTSLLGAEPDRFAGADRFATSALLADDGFGEGATHAYLATGYQFPDALAGSALAAAQHAPLFTVQTDCVPTSTLHEIADLGVTTITLLGGTGALTANVGALHGCDAAPTSSVLWSTRAPMPSGITSTDSSIAVSCPAADDCVALTRPRVAETFNGSTWTPTKLPLPSDAKSGAIAVNMQLDCPTTAFCAAVGVYQTTTDVSAGFLATRSSSGTWTSVAAPIPSSTPGGTAQPSAIDCASATSCTAVGTSYAVSNKAFPFAEQWNGSGWDVSPIPQPADVDATNGAVATFVSCPAVSDCWTAGDYTDTSHRSRVFASEVSAGSAGWSTFTFAPPSNAATNPDVSATGLSCARIDSCAFVGSYSSTSASYTGFVETLDGSGWTQTAALTTSATRTPYPTDVSCWAVGRCTIVGVDVDNSSPLGSNPIAQSLYGGAWTLASLPEPTEATAASYTQPDHVDCTASGDCVAAGGYQASTDKLFIETRHNGAWTLTTPPVPQPQDPDVRVSSLSCTDNGFCAIGAWNTTFS